MPSVSASLPARDDETLDRYAAAGGMATDRIRRILADLAPALRDLHQAGRAHGDIAPSTIGWDAYGRARLLTPPLAPAANAENATRRDGYAAFEQYTDDPDTPCGPWTDIYALSAIACALLTGLAPPPALARCVRDDYVPLVQRRGPEEQAFCAVLDSGLAMDARARPRDIEEFARALGFDAAPAAAAKETPAPAEAALAEAALAATSQAGATPAIPEVGAGAGAAAAPVDVSPMAAGAGPRRQPNSLEDPDGLPPAADTEPAAGRESGVTLYREGRLADTPAATARATAQDAAAAQYAEAVASVHTREDPERRYSKKEPPRASASRKHRPRQRAPRLLVLAVSALIAVVLYVWLRPQPSPRIRSVARVSTTAPGNTQGDASKGTQAGASNAATGSAPEAVPGKAQEATTGKAQEAATGKAQESAGDGAEEAPGNSPTSLASAAPSGTAPVSTSNSPSVSPSNGAATSMAAQDNPGLAPGTSTAPPSSVGSASPAAVSMAPGASATSPAATSASAPSASATSASSGGTDAGTAVAKAAKPDAESGATANTAAKPHVPAASKAPVAVAVAIRPWGEVLVNGKSRGVSPPLNSLKLPPGKYDITVRNNAGPDYHQTLNVTADRNATIAHTFQ